MGVIIKDRKVSLGLLVPKEKWPETVSLLSELGLIYGSEKQIVSDILGECVKIRDIEGRGDELSSLIWHLSEYGGKAYILLNASKREVSRNAGKNRKKARAGRDGGNSGKADIDR